LLVVAVFDDGTRCAVWFERTADVDDGAKLLSTMMTGTGDRREDGVGCRSLPVIAKGFARSVQIVAM